MDVATMRRAFPGLGAARAAELNSGLNTALRLAGCTTVKRAAMFCAQLGEESISLTAGLNGFDERKNRWHICLKLGNAILPTPAILEDSMLLNKGQDAITPIALPSGTNVVRFFSDQSAQLGVDTRDGKPMAKLNLNKTVAPVVAVPHDIHAFIAHRLDDGTNDISVAFGA
jgi:hypothetical protein